MGQGFYNRKMKIALMSWFKAVQSQMHIKEKKKKHIFKVYLPSLMFMFTQVYFI